MKRLRPRTLTLDRLKELGACWDGREAFEELFKGEVKLTSKAQFSKAVWMAYTQGRLNSMGLDWLALEVGRNAQSVALAGALIPMTKERKEQLLDLYEKARDAYWQIPSVSLDRDIDTIWDFFMACDAANFWLWEKRK